VYENELVVNVDLNPALGTGKPLAGRSDAAAPGRSKIWSIQLLRKQGKPRAGPVRRICPSGYRNDLNKEGEKGLKTGLHKAAYSP